MNPILLADDDPIIIDLYTRKFTKAGYTVEAATDGEEAVAKASEIRPALILLDRLLPKLDGLEVLKRLHENPETQNIPVIVLTNLDESQEKIQEAKSLGAVDYLIKEHVDLNELAEKIKPFLEKS